jgi:hypothetical protein
MGSDLGRATPVRLTSHVCVFKKHCVSFEPFMGTISVKAEKVFRAGCTATNAL